MVDPTQVADWGKAVGAWLSPTLVLVGWYIINRQANRRETRKEVRQQLDRVIKLIESAVDLGFKVHSSALPLAAEVNQDAVAEKVVADTLMQRRQLKFALAQLSPLVQGLRDRGVKSSDITDALIDIRSTLTGDDFETAEQKPWPPTDPRWAYLSGNCVRLVACLEQAYIEKYGKDGGR